MARIVLVAGMLLSPCWLAAAEPALPREYVLNRWEESSRACESFTANVIGFQYNPLRTAETRTKGRIRWETDGRAYYVRTTENLLWQNGDLTIGGRRYSHTVLQAARKRLFDVDKPPTAWEKLTLWPASYAEFDDVLPLLMLPDARQAWERFEIATDHQAVGILVTATPKRRQDAVRWQRVDLLLDRITFRPIAHRILNGPARGRGEIVHMFENVRINEPDDIIPQLLESGL